MIFKIALIEDSLHDRNATKACFEKWSRRASVPVQLLCYTDAADFFANEDDWKDCVCIFLDIDLPTTNGIDIAKKLRTSGIMTDFIFLTAFREYVFEGYSVEAIDYLLKPLDQAALDKCMTRILARYQSGFYIFRSGNDIVQLPYSNILYFSSARHYTDIVTSERSFRQRKPLTAILSTLPEQFVQIHRTIIINLHKVYSLSGTTVIMMNRLELPVSKTFADHLNAEFAKHMF